MEGSEQNFRMGDFERKVVNKISGFCLSRQQSLLEKKY